MHRWRPGVAAAACFLALAWVGASSTQLWHLSSNAARLPSLGDGIVSGLFVAGAAAAVVVSWRRQSGSVTRRVVPPGAPIAVQALLVTLLALGTDAPRGTAVLGLVLAVAVVGMIAVIAPLLRLSGGHDRVVDDSFAIGLGLGLVAAGHLLLAFPIDTPPAPLVQLVVGVLISTHVAATALVLDQRSLARPVRWLLAATVPAIGLEIYIHSAGLSAPGWIAVGTIGRAAVGAAWLCVGWVAVRRTLAEERRRINSVQQVLATSARDQRERMHELRSTVAGLVSGSALLDSPEVSLETRHRLLGSVRHELDRMDRMLSGHAVAPTDIDLDDALTLILDLQRLKGRRVDFRSNGDVVHARFDALVEVVNILMDNAATHGGSDASLVEVVRRDEETVDITVSDSGHGIPLDERAEVFEWGRRGSTSPGEGIGLHVARRLMTEDGGSLRLADDQGSGSSFVISLPAARRSTENLSTVEDRRARLRSG